ncbi:hypothetical protein VUR80DRAFT_7805 [Thermomyces stellatus]
MACWRAGSFTKSESFRGPTLHHFGDSRRWCRAQAYQRPCILAFLASPRYSSTKVKPAARIGRSAALWLKAKSPVCTPETLHATLARAYRVYPAATARPIGYPLTLITLYRRDTTPESWDTSQLLTLSVDQTLRIQPVSSAGERTPSNSTILTLTARASQK